MTKKGSDVTDWRRMESMIQSHDCDDANVTGDESQQLHAVAIDHFTAMLRS